MKTARFTQRQIHGGTLRLVNAQNPIPAGFAAPHLVDIGASPTGQRVRLERQAAKMLACLLEAVGAGAAIRPVSGFRPREEQARLYEDTLRERGEAYTQKYVALPGCSEHETGLALDVAGAAEPFDFVCPAFPQDGVTGRFRDKAARYGFIERYQRGKSHITGIAPEPWHFRYVGWPHSLIMAENGWALEEYIEQLAYRPCFEDAFTRQEREYTLRIFTVPVAADGTAALHLPARALWQASGNNVGGVVVTVWT